MAVSTHLQVLDEYFKRGGDGVKTNFVKVKGFHLLASQLKTFKVSFELMQYRGWQGHQSQERPVSVC